ncbi:lysoplasmalogenase-like protein TMEM86A [Anopheles funestus]|uniref:lysoplasmalogenase-like protein TMEM86A n=1 Tax=Anopheles funestus TaxID=62324 RepID=UPI0020C64827|nr:lysoplasmalogenase-like protein TMEM86A [Anopheles funestus]XP_049301744.1 lysoplasmalogenase-like protein TMEM86A [Anopheles funestus]XP_049301755.1 lysoplasmalogenase-like protein TMEM86A [Anopheles funestus]XP_049301764.1 lysoplasmalogenase-like protein TMEM86A [Anopheles funestus]XP_049301773.1 lysoplasmalogenase-like protein TMEM86A [Anopheles funestus]XP_049301783.1 lysoplasmalogenase-like protein TMEM86A [Anopheles funestus]XP_049301792.1 lysoplasmalogenase-like protein TMEM86A [Ano
MAQSAIGKNDNATISKLIPFITTVLLYFSLIEHTDRSSTPSTVLKCMPIFSLLFFVMLTTSKNAATKQYQQRIMYGLLFSSVGDFLLNYDLFEAGMGAFGIAQVFYISAFGMKPLKLWIGVTLYLLGVMAIAVFFGNLNSIIKVCLPFYAILLLTMCWRSLARIEGSHNYSRLVCGIASILFVISDGIIAFDKFFTPIQAAQTYIMVTYYLAQVGITLSVNDVQLNEPTGSIKPTERRNKRTGTKSY